MNENIILFGPALWSLTGGADAIQHVAGVLGSKPIVAINKDAEANIFKEAHYGMVGDDNEVLPAFKEITLIWLR